MKAGISAAFGLGLALTLASCDGEDPVDSALRDASAARHAAAALTTEQQQTRSASAPAPTATPSGDQALVADLLKAERAARTAAERAQARATDPALRQLAEAQAADSSARIAALEAWTAAAD